MKRRELFKRLAGVAIGVVAAKTVTAEQPPPIQHNARTFNPPMQTELWPVGSVYLSVADYNPFGMLGVGEWRRWGATSYLHNPAPRALHRWIRVR